MPRLKIFFTSTISATFVREDLRLLEKFYDLDLLIASGPLAPLRFIPRVIRSDVTYTWLASVYAFFVVALGRMFGKRTILVVGGADVAKLPEMRYGIWLSPWKAPFVGWAIRHAHRVLVVDPSLQRDAVQLAKYGGENIECVPTGYDATLWKPSGAKEPSVLTVAGCNDIWKMRVKGIDVLFDAARRLPQVPFLVVGFAPSLLEDQRGAAPANVTLMGRVDQPELLAHYRRAAVYCQPSIREGLPNSLCEAMLCECVPVGTRAGGIPTAIGDHGFLVPYGDPGLLAEAIENALRLPADAGRSGREYIARTFTLERREASLRQIIEDR